MDHLTFALGIPQTNKLGNPIPLTFTVTNVSEFDIAILRRHTPLEGVKGNIFQIIDQSGKHLRYDGRLYKRGKPQKEEYEILKKGTSISRVMDLSDFYFFEAPGEFTVELDTLIRDYIVLDHEEKQTQIGANDQFNQYQVSSEKRKFSIIAATGSARSTLGMVARLSEGRLIKLKDKLTNTDLNNVLTYPKPPSFKGGTPKQHQIVTTAHDKAYQYSLKSIDNLKSGGSKNTLYNKWFGEYTSLLYQVVSKAYLAVSSAFETETITYNLSCEGCDTGDYAYTYYQSSTIWLCSMFWDAADKGYDSQFGTIIHELTHSTTNTEDVTYGVEEAIVLAQQSPDEAADNADNYEYFSESLE